MTNEARKAVINLIEAFLNVKKAEYALREAKTIFKGCEIALTENWQFTDETFGIDTVPDKFLISYYDRYFVIEIDTEATHGHKITEIKEVII